MIAGENQPEQPRRDVLDAGEEHLDRQLLHCGVVFVPALVSYAAVAVGLLVDFFLVPLMVLVCACWAWPVGRTVATRISIFRTGMDWGLVYPGPRSVRLLLFVVQVAVILSSWPIVGLFLESIGYRVFTFGQFMKIVLSDR
jgi:hypothetical protein